jgi:P2 family phage major capsid protein
MRFTKQQAQEQIRAGMQKAYGSRFEFGPVGMTVTPQEAQRIEQKLREQYAFLGMINTIFTNDSAGEIIHWSNAKTLSKRTTVALTNGDLRRPEAVSAPTGRDYALTDHEMDVVVTWNEILRWGEKSGEVFSEYRNFITRSRAASILRVGFWGQSYNALVNSNIGTHTMGEDVKKGWLQYMIENNPSNVLGIAASTTDPKGYTIDPIDIGTSGDFPSIAALVAYMKNTIDRLYRNDTGIRAIVGTELGTYDTTKMTSTAGNTPTERQAVETLLSLSTAAGVPMYNPDEFPERALMLVNPMNLQRMVQNDSQERRIEIRDEKKGIVDWAFLKDWYGIGAVEGCAMVHPDAIRFLVGSTWTAASDVWAINPIPNP